MSLDLANTNNLDDVFANYLDKEDFLLFPLQYPTGARLEDEFGSSAKYLPANAFNYTPNGWVLKDEYSSFDSDSFSQITDDDVVNFIDELASFEGEDFSNFRILGIGKLSDKQKKRREKIKKGFDNVKKGIGDKLGGGKAVHAVNKFNPAFVTMRGAMLSVLNKNVVGMADAMAEIKAKSKSHYDKILQKWWMWGGEKTKYDKAIMQGKGKKPLFKELVDKFQKKKKGFDGEYSNAGGSDAAKAVLAASALLGVTTTALTLIPEPATKAAAVWTGAAGTGFGALGGILKSFAKEQGATDAEINQIPEGKDIPNAEVPKDPKELERVKQEVEAAEKAGVADDGTGSEKAEGDKILGMPKTAFWIGVGAVALLSGFLIYKKIKK